MRKTMRGGRVRRSNRAHSARYTCYLDLIVWSRLVDSQRKEFMGSRLLGVTGEVQREGEVVHVLARRLKDHTPPLDVERTRRSLRISSAPPPLLP